jgi:Protein of unknown function (DUF3667)
MEYNCIHCRKSFNENYCNSCGQKKFYRIDKNYIWDEIQYTLIHVNKGFLFSIKSILKNPGKTARAFIDGDRVSHYKPISLAFVLASISAFLSIKGVELYKMMELYLVNQKQNSAMMQEYLQFTTNYNSFIMVLFIPLLAIFTKIVFRKWGQNYYEHVIMNAMGVSLYLILCILILYPILYIFKDNYAFCLKIVTVSIWIVPLLMMIFFKGFYSDKPLKTIVFKLFLLIMILIISYFLVIFMGIMFFVIFKGPQGLEYIKPR